MFAFYIMNNFRVSSIAIIVLTLSFVSCVSPSKVVYLNNLADSASAALHKARTNFDNPIQKNDLLSISVGGVNYEDLSVLNSGSGIIPGATAGAAASKSIGYLVEADGKIQFPFLGRIQAAGLTRLELEDTLTSKLKDYTKDPVVNVKFLNYSYSVLGEVTHPGKFEMDNERTTVLEALGSAGDLTVFGKRDNILVIREVNGERKFGRINLLSKDVFQSPYYYLKANDVIYVEPVRTRFFSRSGITQYISIIAAGVTLLLTLLNLSNL